MTMAPTPPTRALEDVLRDLVAGPGGDLTVVERRANPYASTYATDIVTCQVRRRGAAGMTAETVTLLCKYAPTPDGPHRGLDHEAHVHRAIAAPSGLTLPTLYGCHHDKSTGDTWLVFSFIDGLRLSIGPWPESLVAGATWAGRFHAYWDARMDDPALALLPRRNTPDYEHRLDRAHDLLVDAPSHVRTKACWLTTRWDEIAGTVMDHLASQPPTVIHGEYYVDNILYADGTAWPVDWERAAVAAGELDVAALTDRWGATARALAARAYDVARHGHPEATPPARWQAARLFVQLGWVAEGLDWDDPADCRRLDEARRASRALGIT